MPNKTEEKNNKGVKKATKTSAAKKTNNVKKVVNIPETKVEVKEVPVVKKEQKKGNSLLNNTPFVVACCIIVLLAAALVFVLCIKRVPLTSKGEEIVATIKGKKITADELYLSLKEAGGKDQLLSIIDEYIAGKEVKALSDEDKDYIQEVVDYYKDSAEYYQVDLETLLSNYGLTGIKTEKEFKEFLEKDYKKTIVIKNYIAEKADEETLKEFYKKNYTDTLTVKHILIEVDSEAEDKDEADEAAYKKAVKLIKKLNETDSKKLDAKFEELAKKNSDDTGTYANGGLVENFQKSEVEEAFYDASHELKDGEYTEEPVKTAYGYHIILKVSSTPVKEFKELVEEVKTDYAEEQLNSDSTLFDVKWNELRSQYKLSIKDDIIKKAYTDAVEAVKESKTEK